MFICREYSTRLLYVWQMLIFNIFLLNSSRAEGEDFNSQSVSQCDGVVNLNETYPNAIINMTNIDQVTYCRWNISSPPDTQIIIEFLDFRLNDNDMNIYDSKERRLLYVPYYYLMSLNPNPVISDSRAYIDFDFYDSDYSVLIEARYTGMIFSED